MGRTFARSLTPLLASVAILLPSMAAAEPADIEAAARGVVRVVILEQQGDSLTPISHGTGFAVSAERIVTNAHVVAEARRDRSLAIGIIPSDGDDAVYARLEAVSSRNDLALLATTRSMNLPPLTLSGGNVIDTKAATAVGYPMNVDRAQGLTTNDIFRAQPPVKSTGFLAGRRPTRDFDSLLHTAPLARGNSGGPLLDECGRVIGVNSFGAESGSADAEFFFAVSMRELLPFLRANGVNPQVNAMPCRSLAEVDAQDRERTAQQRLAAQAAATAAQKQLEEALAEARRTSAFAVIDERDNLMALAFILLLLSIGAGGLSAFSLRHGERKHGLIAGGVSALIFIGAAATWTLRPSFAQVEFRAQDRIREENRAVEAEPLAKRPQGQLICVLDSSRSRITGGITNDIPLNWSPDGCVNSRTQYAETGGEWSRVLVPESEAAVSVNHFNPTTSEYRIERYLLGREVMGQLRITRADYQAPSCGASPELIRELAAQQSAIIALLPERPNERLVYSCTSSAG